MARNKLTNNSMMARIVLLICMIALSMVLTSCGAESRELSSEEVVTFVQEELNDRYGQAFVVEKDTLSPEEKNGRVNKWWGYAHLKDDPSKRCYFCMQGEKTLNENFSINYHADDIIALVRKGMKSTGLNGDIEVGYSIYGKKLKDSATAEKILESADCEIYYVQQISYSGNPGDYVELVRQWLRYLYSVDHNWYFEVRDDSKGVKIFLIDSEDREHSKESDWTDEEIIEDIEYYLRFDW